MIKTKLNQKTIAKTLGVTQAAVSHWLNLKAYPSPMAKKLLSIHYPELMKEIDKQWSK